MCTCIHAIFVFGLTSLDYIIVVIMIIDGYNYALTTLPKIMNV
jgi:hypothetical protein